MKSITGTGFKGMRNLNPSITEFRDDTRKLIPRLVVNADVDDIGVVTKRDGFSKLLSLPGAHSLWGGQVILAVAEGTTCPQSLYLIEDGGATELCEVSGPVSRLYYAEHGDRVYYSNEYWQGCYDPVERRVLAWGLDLPEAPQFSVIDGNLPAGKYLLCYTRFFESEFSGSGDIAEFFLGADGGGIDLLNFADDYVVWLTQPGGGSYFLPQMDTATAIIDLPVAQPLKSFGVIPPPKMVALHFAFGRVWGASGKVVYYSDPFQPAWFKPENSFAFPEDIILIASVENGLFVASKNNTWFMPGTVPEKMALNKVGLGAIPGTLAYVSIEGGGYDISKSLSQQVVPAWFSPTGLVIGSSTGHLVYWTKDKIRLTEFDHGGSLFRFRNGKQQIISSLYGPVKRNPVAELETVVSDGGLF